MYGQGNYALQFGQGLQRPMPPYQQHSTGHPPPVVQQAGPPYAIPPRPLSYPHPPPFPPNMGQQAPSVSLPNAGNSYMHPPLNVHHGPPFQHPFPAAQQNYASGIQNPNQLPPPPPPPPPHPHPPPPPPPPPSSLCPPRVPPPPPPPHGQVVYGAQVHQSAHVTPQGIHHIPLQPPMPPGAASSFRPSNVDSAKQLPDADSEIPSMAPPPPPLPPSSPPKPPPPPSCSSPSYVNLSLTPPLQSGNGPSSVQASVSESATDIATHIHNRDDVRTSNEPSSSKQNVMLDLPPPPPKPTDEKIVKNIEILCQFIAKNGPGFEELARQNESGKPEFIFLFGGEPGSQASCAREYYLWMKKKHGLVGNRDLSQGHVDAECSENRNTVSVEGTAHSPADSDVDMEDDITQSEKELGVYNSGEDLKPDSVPTGDMLERQKQENDVHFSRDSTPALNLSQMPKQPIQPEQSVQTNKIDSPIRLIQNYSSDESSDDDAVACDQASKTMVESPSCKLQPTSSHEDMVNDNITSMCGQVSEPGADESSPAYNESVSTKDLDNFDMVQSGAQDKVHESPQGKSTSSPNAAIQENYALESSADYTTVTCKETVKEQKMNTSTELKVDEFGRLVKEGASESESDDSYKVRRHKRGRSRSRSHSRSPSERRRRRSPRRSPRRRKDRRSRSQSWSPKRRRSRSKSPYRHGDHVSGEKPRRDKVQMRECFDFLKGRCYRGASCRYLHHEADKNEGSRMYKSRQHQPEGMVSSRNSGFHGGDSSSRLTQQNNEVKGEKMHLHLDKPDMGDLASKSIDEISKAKSMHDSVQPSLLHKDDETYVADGQKGEASTGGDSQFQGASDEPIYLENPISDTPSTNEQEIHHSQSEASVQLQPHHRLDGETLKMDSATKVDSSTMQTPAVSSQEVPVSEPLSGNMSDIPTGPGGPTSQPQIPHLPPPHLVSQATNVPPGSDQIDQKSMSPAVGFPQPAPVGSGPAYQAPLSNQQSQYSIPPNPSWSIMPPMQPRPPYITEPPLPGPPLQFQQFQQGNLSLRNDFPGQGSLRNHPAEFPSHSQVGGFQHPPYNLHLSNLPTQPFGGASLVRDDRYSQFPSQGVAPSSSFASASVPPQPIPFLGDSSVKNMPPFPGDSLPFSESSKPTLQNHSYSQQRPPPPYGLQLTAADGTSSRLGGSLSVSVFSSDPLDRDSSRFLGIGGSKISAHYNPYASTFDRPLTTRFTSAAFTQEREAAASSKYDSSFNLGHGLVGQTSSDHGLNKLILSPNSSKGRGKNLPKSGGDQYDPLFDSIEPSSESFKKHVHKQDHVADNSNKMKKLSGHYKVLDVEENNKQKEVGVVAATMSLENDEFGETADAEVGAVENGSPSEPDEDAIVAEGEIEIDQVKPEGKNKKSKDSRSMKLFKIAVANFVKEVLKPQWRQGNMSKEVFKTIVKKTVDKVSGAMKNHRIPKSQAKIDHYIDSSRRKLTQLVEGYVSKYKS